MEKIGSMIIENLEDSDEQFYQFIKGGMITKDKDDLFKYKYHIYVRVKSHAGHVMRYRGKLYEFCSSY